MNRKIQTNIEVNNKKTTIDGITFDSKAEAKRYQELKLMEQAGLIKDLVLQPKFELLKSFKRKGRLHRKIEYVADFTYFDNQRQTEIIEDVKGISTDVFNLKKKLFLYKLDESVVFLIIKKNKIMEY